MTRPRIAPLPVNEWRAGLLDEALEIAGGNLRAEANVYRTLANSPDLFLAWLRLGSHLLRRSTLDPITRELVILRTVAVAQAAYPFAQHVRIGAEVGLSDADIAATVTGRSDPHWQRSQRLVLVTVDELFVNNSIGDQTWAALGAEYSTPQVLDLIATVAFYRMAAWTLNAAGTELDDGQTSGPDLRATTEQFAGELAPPTPEQQALAPWARVADARIERRPVDEWPPDLLADTATWPRFVANPDSRAAGVYTTLANHPGLFSSLGPFIAHLLLGNSLGDRHRELVIVRSCLRDRGEYPYRQHVRIGGDLGLEPKTLSALAMPSPRLDDPADALLAALVDGLHDHNRITESIAPQVSSTLTDQQLFDAIATAGFYGVISFILNAAGTRLEPGNVLLPADTPTKEFPWASRSHG